MQVLACESAITLGVSGVPECSSGWLVADPASFPSAPMTVEEFNYLGGMTVLCFVIAFGAKLIRKQMGY